MFIAQIPIYLDEYELDWNVKVNFCIICRKPRSKGLSLTRWDLSDTAHDILLNNNLIRTRTNISEGCSKLILSSGKYLIEIYE